MDESLQPPQRTWGDTAHTLARAGIGTLPIIGNAGTELFTAIVTPPLEKRRESWRARIGERIIALETAGYLKAEDVENNEPFISAVTRASQMAMATHDQEKLDMLANAALNAAIGQETDEAKRQLFLRFVDELTVWHIRLLKYLQDTTAARAARGLSPKSILLAGSIRHVLDGAFPELERDETLRTSCNPNWRHGVLLA
jgi:hypothetical protein